MSENQVITNMENEVEEMTAIHYLNQDNAVFERTEGGFLSLSYEGKKWDRIQVEERSHEIGVIKNIKEVDKKTRKMLLEQLNLHYFTPVIQKILDIKDEYGYAYFHVMTDRGECRFTINMGSNAVVRLSDCRLLITDLDENRFEIRDVFALSQKEQRKLDLFL